jgi:hypothetical protein
LLPPARQDRSQDWADLLAALPCHRLRGVKRLHDDGVARLHTERGRVSTHRVEESLSIEMVRGHAIASKKDEAGRVGIVALEVAVQGILNCLCNYRDIVI